MSKATLYATFAHLKRFLQWLAGQPGYKSRLRYLDAEYFNLSDNDRCIATARRERAFLSVEQVKHVIGMMSFASEIELRNRALVAFTLLTGARDSAIASMRLKQVDLSSNSVHQDAREVRTKFSKTFTTYFFPVGDEIRQIFIDWVMYLRNTKLWGNDDPLFPATHVALGESLKFEAAGALKKTFHQPMGRAQWDAEEIQTVHAVNFDMEGPTAAEPVGVQRCGPCSNLHCGTLALSFRQPLEHRRTREAARSVSEPNRVSDSSIQKLLILMRFMALPTGFEPVY